MFNFHPTFSLADYMIPAPPGRYRLILNSDDTFYGGHGRLTPDQVFLTLPDKAGKNAGHRLSFYLPTRTALVLLAE